MAYEELKRILLHEEKLYHERKSMFSIEKGAARMAGFKKKRFNKRKFKFSGRSNENKPQCFHCNKPGHLARNCWHKEKDTQPNEQFKQKEKEKQRVKAKVAKRKTRSRTRLRSYSDRESSSDSSIRTSCIKKGAKILKSKGKHKVSLK